MKFRFMSNLLLSVFKNISEKSFLNVVKVAGIFLCFHCFSFFQKTFSISLTIPQSWRSNNDVETYQSWSGDMLDKEKLVPLSSSSWSSYGEVISVQLSFVSHNINDNDDNEDEDGSNDDNDDDNLDDDDIYDRSIVLCLHEECCCKHHLHMQLE